jgi:Ca2+-binding RTX toxin-like protein
VSIFSASTTAGLSTALSSARLGDVIQLAPGAYAGVSINNFDVGGGVTITSQDPTRKAVITNMKVTYSSGLNFENLEFSYADAVDDAGTNAFGIKVQNSSDIHFRNDSMHGVLDADVTLDIGGLMFTSVSNISVENSEFQQLRVAINEGAADGAKFIGNNFHDIRADGIDTAKSTNVLIQNNNFSNFRHVTGDHSDAIQFFTGGQTVSSSNITITGNVFVQGQGVVMQGVWINDEVGTLPFQNVLIRDNLVVGGNWNALVVGHGQNVTADANTIVQISSQTTPWLKMNNVDTLNMTDNTAPLISSSGSNIIQSGNLLNKLVSDQGQAALTNWLAAHSRSVANGPLSASDLVNDTMSGGSSSTTGSSTTGASTTTTTSPAITAIKINGQTLTGLAGQANTLTGGAKNDYIKGASLNDLITGNGGDDVLWGGGGNDTFAFRKGSGHDVVADFSRGDTLDISSYAKLGLKPVVHDASDGLVISFTSGDTIKLLGAHPTDLMTNALGFGHI